MKKVFTMLAGLLLFGAVFAQQVNDPNAEVRDAKNFHAIRVGSAFDVYLTQGNEEKVAVSASDKKHLEYIQVEVKSGVLTIRWQGKGKWNIGNKKLKAYISFKSIDNLDIGGACDVKIVGILKAANLKVDLSGASDLDGKVEADAIIFKMSGASDAKVTGKAGKLSITASGASSFKGYDFTADYCDARASGASGIRLTVNKELSVNASGASDVSYKGKGVIREVKTSGSSSLSHRES